MVTPSLVIVGAPHFLSSTTLRPLGPRVTLTTLARRSTPASSLRRASELNTSCFAIAFLPQSPRRHGSGPASGARAEPERPAGPPGRPRLLGDDREHVTGGEDQVLLAADLDLGA